MAFADRKNNSRQAWSVTGVVLVHVAIGYVFVVGLANHFTPRRIWEPIETYPVAKQDPPPPIKEKAKPQQHPPLTPPIVDTGPEPQGHPIDLRIETPIARPDPIPPAPPITVFQRAVQVKGDRSTWITTELYPPESIRNGEEGRVEITVMVGTNGRVTDCQVTKSSGYPALDAATCRYYPKRARFTPAIGSDGMPVAASYVDRVRWQLPE